MNTEWTVVGCLVGVVATLVATLVVTMVYYWRTLPVWKRMVVKGMIRRVGTRMTRWRRGEITAERQTNGTWRITYWLHDQRYQAIIAADRTQPPPILLALTDTGVDVTDTVTEWLGPRYDWHVGLRSTALPIKIMFGPTVTSISVEVADGSMGTHNVTESLDSLTR